MSNKNKHKSGIVFSTDPGYSNNIENSSNDNDDSVASEKQPLRIFLDRKPGGKLVTRISGFKGSSLEISVLASELKKLCGVGGTVKDEEILIQGDHRDKVLAHLIKNGFKLSKKAGG